MKVKQARKCGGEQRQGQGKREVSATTTPAKPKGDVGDGRTVDEEQRVVVVGMTMDAPSKELLTWALVNVAKPRDRVFAIHVLPNPPSSSSSYSLSSGGKSTSLLKLVKEFDSLLEAYEGLCNSKQIELKLKLCRDASVRKGLVREAAELQASKLVLGVNNSRHGFGSSTSVAKHCAKKLPPTCSVVAMDNGKVVFQRTDSRSCKTDQAKGNNEKPNTQAERHARTSSCLLPGIQHAHPCSDAKYKKSPLSNASAFRSSSFDSPRSGSDGSSRSGSPHSNDENPFALVPVPSTTPRSVSVLIRELPESRPGWPLLRKAVLQNNKAAAAAAAAAANSKISVVQWVMQLPDRYPESPVHPDHKLTDTEEMVRECDANSNEDAAVAQAEARGKKDERLESLRTKYEPVCKLFAYKQLADATSNFSKENLIGRGGNSHVYRGCLPGGREMAVKIMKQTDEARKELALEIEIITALHHKNIITLLGFCVEDDSLFLVYDFLPRGSLEDNLHGDKHKKCELGWSERYKVAVGVGEALQHLHSGGSTRPVIHRDVKSSNILLSDNYEPKLSDFGFATWVSSASSHITCTDVAGTFGYLAPEYFMFGKVNEKIDVYAFGVVLLELLSGKKPIGDEYPKGRESLIIWAKPILQSMQLSLLMDSSLGSQYDEDQVELMVLAALLCLRQSPQLRPKMDLVLKLLKGDSSLVKWARLQMKSMKDPEGQCDDEADIKCLSSDFQSHLNLALLDIEDDTHSVSSTEHSISDIIAHGSLEAYLQGRWSRSSSFD